MVEYFNSDDSEGTIAMTNSYITFNKTLLKYFSDTYRVRVGIDKEIKKAYFQLLNKDYALSGEIALSSLLSISISKTYARVCSSQMIKYLCDGLGLTITKGQVLKYNATYDKTKKEIIVDFTKGCID